MLKLWVASLISPIRNGPVKPPRLPIETIIARPPAAARPVRKVDGIAQNVAWNDRMLATATHRLAIFSTGCSVNAAATSATAANARALTT
ncbi:hypothetical protein D3C79_998180 [compost metagenome]